MVKRSRQASVVTHAAKRKSARKADRSRASEQTITRIRRDSIDGTTKEPVEMKDNAVEAALASGEHSGLLEDYFGTFQYAELRRLCQETGTREVRGGERVLILPGI